LKVERSGKGSLEVVPGRTGNAVPPKALKDMGKEKGLDKVDKDSAGYI